MLIIKGIEDMYITYTPQVAIPIPLITNGAINKEDKEIKIDDKKYKIPPLK